jgi:hypothetical protein
MSQNLRGWSIDQTLRPHHDERLAVSISSPKFTFKVESVILSERAPERTRGPNER